MTDFTIDDLNVLMEAMEAWENKDTAGDLMGSVLGAMLMPRNDPDAKAAFEAEEERRRVESLANRANRKERSILLRAKLIQMLDSARAGRLTADPIAHA